MGPEWLGGGTGVYALFNGTWAPKVRRNPDCTDVLAGVLDLMQEHGDKIPPPTPFDETRAIIDAHWMKAQFTVLVPATLRGRAVTVSVTMDEE